MKKKTRIVMDDLFLENFIMDLLSCPAEWNYHSMSQPLKIVLKVKDKRLLQRKIFEWLERRVG